MPRKRAGRATWFKIDLAQKPLFDSVPDETVGRALKLALAYFLNGDIPTLDQLTNAIFAVLKASVDEASCSYAQAVTNGSKGGRPKGNPPLPMATQATPPQVWVTDKIKDTESSGYYAGNFPEDAEDS